MKVTTLIPVPVLAIAVLGYVAPAYAHGCHVKHPRFHHAPPRVCAELQARARQHHVPPAARVAPRPYSEPRGSAAPLTTIIGAGLGALAGSQVGSGRGQLAAVGVGAFFGALIGHEIGASLDRSDQQAMESAAYTAFEDGAPGRVTTWHNPDTGHYGSVTPQEITRNDEGVQCREYRAEIVIDGEVEVGHGTACRQEDGTWRIAGR